MGHQNENPCHCRGKPKCTMKLMIIFMSLIVVIMILIVDNSKVKAVPNRPGPLKVMMIVWNVINTITVIYTYKIKSDRRIVRGNPLQNN